MALTIRPYHPHDAPVLAALYRESVLHLGPQAYSGSQVRQWAAFADSAGFMEGLGEGVTLVADVDDKIAGFAQLNPTDHIYLVYVLGEYGNQGIATALVRKLLKTADASGCRKVTAYASLLSRRLFENLGFVIVEEETSFFRGLAFRRFVMQRDRPGGC